MNIDLPGLRDEPQAAPAVRPVAAADGLSFVLDPDPAAVDGLGFLMALAPDGGAAARAQIEAGQ